MKNISRFSVAVIQSLSLLCLFCCLMLLFRFLYVGSVTYWFLTWNLFLAVVPLAVAIKYLNTYRKKGIFHPMSVFLFVTWLLFFPNAPYIITDLIHLVNTNFEVPVWYDALMVFSFAFTGVVAGLLSVVYIYQAVKDHLRELRGIMFMGGVFILTGYGIYLGRILRWNSWDMFTRPHKVLGDMYSNISDPAAWGMTAMFSAFLFFLWFVFHTFISGKGRNMVKDEFD